MFILVNHNMEVGGVEEVGRYDTSKAAAIEIAKVIVNVYQFQIDVDRFINTQKRDDNNNFMFDCDDGKRHVWFNGYECWCYDDLAEDEWLIIEV